MKLTMVVFVLLCSWRFAAAAQDQFAWIRLTENRVLISVLLKGIQGDSLLVLRDGKNFFVPIGEMTEIRTLKEGSMLGDVAIGMGIGAAVGGLAGLFANPSNDGRWNAGTGALYIGILCGIVGSVVGSMPDSTSVQDLSGMTNIEKKAALGRILIQ